MIGTEQPITQTLPLDSQKLPQPRKQTLVARWRKVKGKLVCQWLSESID